VTSAPGCLQFPAPSPWQRASCLRPVFLTLCYMEEAPGNAVKMLILIEWVWASLRLCIFMGLSCGCCLRTKPTGSGCLSSGIGIGFGPGQTLRGPGGFAVAVEIQGWPVCSCCCTGGGKREGRRAWSVSPGAWVSRPLILT
jgi:hypothetical protein